MIKYIPLILLGVTINAFAQIFLKKGMMTIGHFAFSMANAIPVGMQIVTNFWVVLGVTCYVVSLAIWMLVLSRVDVSYAYPFVSVGYIISIVVGYMYLNEDVTLIRVVGVALICSGVICVAKS